ncbi:MAG: ATP-dependent DNA helicase RecG [Pseudomonadota bacterium]
MPSSPSKADATPLLLQPTLKLRGVGPALSEKLAAMGVHRIEDLLFQMPLRYEDRTRITPIGAAQPGTRTLVEGEVAIAEVAFRPRRTLLVRIMDGTSQMTLRFFHFTNAQKAAFVRGRRLTAFGDLRVTKSGREMVHPEYRLLSDGESANTEQGLTPIYPTTDGVHQQRMRKLVMGALDLLRRNAPEELVPTAVLERLRLPTLSEALHTVHQPPPNEDTEPLLAASHPAQQRLALEELLAHQVSLRLLRRSVQEEAAPPIPPGATLVQELLRSLPFTPTEAQHRVFAEIVGDMAAPHPMLRLVQGDVGSGKTLVAALAAAAVIDGGLQCAMMAPTELLAEQHEQSFKRWLTPLGIPVVRLAGSLKAAERRAALAAIEGGRAKMVVGTHALFQESVTFANLGLVIIDEQHRFGVHQRLALRDKGGRHGLAPHQLVMTATPIPRTLAMTAYADLDTSIIDELPPGRTPVTTVVIPESRRDEVIERVRTACQEGRQVYWVCPLVETSEQLEAQAAEETAEVLTEALPEIPVGLVHGRLRAQDKAQAMAAFSDGQTRLLVATTVIEVGVDVPNASLMIIENAERMGLSQLHQLRGRVGRGAAASTCVLLYKAPLSNAAKARLGVMRETNDGFVIAEKDLELRGPGELLGTRQTGSVAFRLADIKRDAHLLPSVQQAASAILSQSDRTGSRIIELLLARWIGDASRYGNV